MATYYIVFKNDVTKAISKSPSRWLFRLRGKLKPNEKEKSKNS